MKLLKLNSILLLVMLILNSCNGEDESVHKKEINSIEKSGSTTAKTNSRNSSDFENVYTITEDGLTYESKNVTTELQNERINNLVVKDSKGDILLNITTKVVANPDVNLYTDEFSDDTDLDVYIYEGENLVYQTAARNGMFLSEASYLVDDYSNGKYKCSFSGNLQCVDDRLTSMSVSQYLHCLWTAEICYASQWIICVKANCYGIYK
jgi:hypothetical protein